MVITKINNDYRTVQCPIQFVIIHQANLDVRLHHSGSSNYYIARINTEKKKEKKKRVGRQC